jgi:pimeloyl-ACP methyl ester carboxylesterase
LITYTETGSGPACILVHGAGANRNYWKSLVNDFPLRHFFIPDLYGHGDTPAWISSDKILSYSYGEDVEMVDALSRLSGFPIDLVGHSSGGAICLEYARRFPEKVRRMVVIEPMLPTVLKDTDRGNWLEVSRAYEETHAKIEEGRFLEAARNLFGYILGDGEWEKLPEKIRNWMTRNVETTLAAHSKASLALETDLEEYGKLKPKVLILYGSETRKPYKKICDMLSERLPHSTLKEIRGASHNSPLTHAASVNEHVKNFLSAT